MLRPPHLVLRKIAADLVAHLPKGRALSDDVWRLRHRTLSNLLRGHVAVIAVLALVTGGVGDALVFGGSVAVFAVLAVDHRRRRRSFSAAMCALGLVTSSAVLVHLSGGTIEMHFHFFVMVGVLTLYQDWLPFLIAIGMVVGHHTVIGVLAPEAVYNHPAAIAHPFRWALIHGGFVLAASVASVVAWRLNEQHALTDALTGLANRRLFKDRAGHALARSRRRGSLAVLFVDLDRFKEVNDSFGHAAGDELLVTVAERLATCLRSGDTPARLGGDEFAVLADDLDGPSGAVALAERILARLSEPSVMHGKVLTVRASIGVALGAPGMSTEELLRNADVAMYTAKAAGRGRCQIYEDGMHTAVVRRMELNQDLERAVDGGQLILHYQPVVVLASGRMSGLEALVRWNHPTRGLIGPDEFLPQAEASGAVVAIGGWVLDEACRQAAEWQTRYPEYPLTMAVNLSPRQLLMPDAVDAVDAALRRSGLAPGDLLLELTEGVMVHDTGVVLEHLDALKALGVRLAIDDFGTGYSSLSYLRTLPFDVLKIDKQFTAGIGRDASDSAFALAIVELARTLGLETIAEGVERPEQVAELAALGCGMAQGYHFARPLTPEAVDALLAATAREGWASVPHVPRATLSALWSASHPSSPE